MSASITVVGSINMDLVVRCDEIPSVGETLIGKELLQIPGGKGANQAVALAKLNNDVIFLGKIGRDNYGHELLQSMNRANINTTYIERENISTGIAIINVDKYGNNNIVVIPGANGEVDKDYLNKNVEAIDRSDIILFQLEIPIETVKEGLKISKKLGKTTILNPAPAADLDDEMISNIDILIPNEHELERMSKVVIKDEESLVKAAKVLLSKGIKEIIVTLGSKGVFYMDHEKHQYFEAYKVDVIDTTAAGDSFIGGFISSYGENKDIVKSINMGQKAASITIQRIGAQSSLPTESEIERINI
ncbi:MAG: ribokinase [Tissierellaceae bacterium]|nr:ribokinase [Tissierellaceae bacterium]